MVLDVPRSQEDEGDERQDRGEDGGERDVLSGSRAWWRRVVRVAVMRPEEMITRARARRKALEGRKWRWPSMVAGVLMARLRWGAW